MIGPKGNCRIHAAHLHYVCMYVYSIWDAARIRRRNPFGGCYASWKRAIESLLHAAYIHREKTINRPATFFFSFSSSTHILSKQTGDARAVAAVAQPRPCQCGALLESPLYHTVLKCKVRDRWRARARGGGVGVGHDNDIDDDDGELTFLLCSVELSPTYAVVHGGGGGGGIRRGGYLRRLPSQGKSVEEVEGGWGLLRPLALCFTQSRPKPPLLADRPSDQPTTEDRRSGLATGK